MILVKKGVEIMYYINLSKKILIDRRERDIELILMDSPLYCYLSTCEKEEIIKRIINIIGMKRG